MIHGLISGLGLFFHGFLFGLGFFLALGFFLFIMAVLIAAAKKAKNSTKFSIDAFQKYARKLREEEKYEELRVVKSILDAMHDGEEPNSKLLEPYEMKTDSKLKVKGSSISIKKEEYIIRKNTPAKKKD